MLGSPFGNLWINAYLHYPKHIVVSNVLRRLLVPRHPPCALNNLIYVSTILERSSNFKKPVINLVSVLSNTSDYIL